MPLWCSIDNGGGCAWCGKGVYGNSIISAQFCCYPKADLKNKANYLKKRNPITFSYYPHSHISLNSKHPLITLYFFCMVQVLGKVLDVLLIIVVAIYWELKCVQTITSSNVIFMTVLSGWHLLSSQNWACWSLRQLKWLVTYS